MSMSIAVFVDMNCSMDSPDNRQDANYCEIVVLGGSLPGGYRTPLTLILALLVYDHILTFPGEVRFIWGRRFSGATVIFTLNRYVTLFGKIVLPVSTLWWPNQTDQVSGTPTSQYYIRALTTTN